MLPCIHTIRAPGIALLCWITDLFFVLGHLFVLLYSYTPSKLWRSYYVCYRLVDTATIILATCSFTQRRSRASQ